MAYPSDIEDAELYRRWRRAEGGDAPDALTLAAYAEGRLAPEEAEAVGRLLAAHPGAAEDLEIARALDGLGLPPRDALAERVAARAAALVAPPAPNVVPFPTRQPRFLMRQAGSWAALAASVAITAWLGFSLGADTYARLAGDEHAAAGFDSDLLDPPSGLFGGFGDADAT